MNIANTLFDESINVETIIWMSALADTLPSSAKDFFRDESVEDLSEIFGVEIPSDYDGDEEEISTFLMRKKFYGFVVLAYTPVPVDFHEDGFTSHGFGYTTGKWFYTEALDEAFAQRMVEWKESFVGKKRAEWELENNPQK